MLEEDHTLEPYQDAFTVKRGIMGLIFTEAHTLGPLCNTLFFELTFKKKFNLISFEWFGIKIIVIYIYIPFIINQLK
jgi:hypothetical protein